MTHPVPEGFIQAKVWKQWLAITALRRLHHDNEGSPANSV